MCAVFFFCSPHRPLNVQVNDTPCEPASSQMDSVSLPLYGSKRRAIVRDSADPSDEKYLRAMAHSDVDQRELLARSEALNHGLTQREGGSSDAMPSAAAAPALLSAGKVEGGGSLLASQVPHCSPRRSSCRSGCLAQLAAT